MATEKFYEQYTNELIKQAGLAEKGEENSGFAQKLALELEKRMGLMVFKELSGTELEQYAKLVDKKALPDKLNEFFTEHISDFDKKRQKVLEDFAFGFLQRTATMKKTLDF